jgi:hypothetical protein
MSAKIQVDKYFAALERLKARGEPISNDAVALEAGSGRGSIKKSRPAYAELIAAIDAAAKQLAEAKVASPCAYYAQGHRGSDEATGPVPRQGGGSVARALRPARRDQAIGEREPTPKARQTRSGAISIQGYPRFVVDLSLCDAAMWQRGFEDCRGVLEFPRSAIKGHSSAPVSGRSRGGFVTPSGHSNCNDGIRFIAFSDACAT